MTENKYECKICNRKYASNNSLRNHNKKFHNDEEIIHKCEHCNKIFTRKDNLTRHSKNCKSKNKSEIIQLKNKVQDLEKILITNNIITNNNNNTVNNNTLNTVNNNNNNTVNNNTLNKVNILINHPGYEDINGLTEKEILFILGENISSIVTLIETLNFNKRLPSNHNFCSTNLESTYCKSYDLDKNEFIKLKKRYFFINIINKSYDKLVYLYNTYKNKLKTKTKKEMSEALETLKKIITTDYNPKLFKEFIDAINLLSYNNKDMILNTWSLFDNQNDALTFQEELDNFDIKPKLLNIKLVNSDTSDSE